jgi:hypothetical protein
MGSADRWVHGTSTEGTEAPIVAPLQTGSARAKATIRLMVPCVGATS